MNRFTRFVRVPTPGLRARRDKETALANAAKGRGAGTRRARLTREIGQRLRGHHAARENGRRHCQDRQPAAHCGIVNTCVNPSTLISRNTGVFGGSRFGFEKSVSNV